MYPNGFVNCVKAPVHAADGPEASAFDNHMTMGSGNVSSPAAFVSYNGTMGSMNATWNGTFNGTAAEFRLGAVIPVATASAGPADGSAGDLSNSYTATGPSASSQGLDPLAGAMSDLIKLLSPLSGEVSNSSCGCSAQQHVTERPLALLMHICVVMSKHRFPCEEMRLIANNRTCLQVYLSIANSTASGGGYVVKQGRNMSMAERTCASTSIACMSPAKSNRICQQCH